MSVLLISRVFEGQVILINFKPSRNHFLLSLDWDDSAMEEKKKVLLTSQDICFVEC